MDSKEILYEISLKYNTLKMYENTIEQMKKNGNNGHSIDKIELEKKAVENELAELLNPDFDNDNVQSENKFLKEANKQLEYDDIYAGNNSFFDEIAKQVNDAKLYGKKPTYSDIQDKISNAKWISRSNFIVRFPKNEVDIEEWRVAGFYYNYPSDSSQKGEIRINVNDFSEKKEDGKYRILSNIVNKLYSHKVKPVGDIYVDVIDNNGEKLYTLRFTNCTFEEVYPDAFGYDSTALRRFELCFKYDNVIVHSPE